MVQNQVASPYDKRALGWGLFGIFVTGALMSVLPQGAGFLILFPIALIGFGKNRTLLLMWTLLAATVFTMGNPYLFKRGVIFLYSNRILYVLISAIMTLQIIGLRKAVTVKPFLFILPYLLYMALVSSQGWMPLISYLKLILFAVIFFAFYSVATAAATRLAVRPETLRSVFLSFACFILLGSIALIPFPSISLLRVEDFFYLHGYYPDEALFMGVTGQSQTLGPLAAVLATFLLADWLFNIKKWSWLYALLFACAPILIYKTGSRTAMGTYLAGLLFVFFFFMRAKGLGARWKERVLVLGFFLGFVAILSLFATPSMRASVRDFLFKWDKGEEITDKTSLEKLTSSRQELVDAMKKNIEDSPAIGNGFQVSKEMQYREVRNFNQLLSQPVEKGVWIYAVMEEGGYFGMGLFLLFLLVVFTSLLSHRAYVTVAVFATFVISNFGEFTFFSMSGMGGIFWALIFVAAVFDAQAIRRRRQLMITSSQLPAESSRQAAGGADD